MTNTAVLNQDPILTEIVKGLIREFNPIRIFLFGSRARGDSNEGSDYDLLVIVADTKESGIHLAQKAHRRVFRGIHAPIDVVFFTEKKFEERKSVIGSLSETAIHEGKELYVA
jgi:predicted nucleotidyltransferase